MIYLRTNKKTYQASKISKVKLQQLAVGNLFMKIHCGLSFLQWFWYIEFVKGYLTGGKKCLFWICTGMYGIGKGKEMYPNVWMYPVGLTSSVLDSPRTFFQYSTISLTPFHPLLCYPSLIDLYVLCLCSVFVFVPRLTLCYAFSFFIFPLFRFTWTRRLPLFWTKFWMCPLIPLRLYIYLMKIKYIYFNDLLVETLGNECRSSKNRLFRLSNSQKSKLFQGPDPAYSVC